MKKNTRRQLTLFVDKSDASEIESIRKKFNPGQYQLIDSHVTLCREDEIENIAIILENLQQLDTPKITIQFGHVIRFDNGNGVLLPASGENEQYHQLRSKILEGSGVSIKQHQPHITLMHPRNSNCTGEVFKEIQNANLPASLSFETISLIEQVDGRRWQIVKQYKLG